MATRLWFPSVAVKGIMILMVNTLFSPLVRLNGRPVDGTYDPNPRLKVSPVTLINAAPTLLKLFVSTNVPPGMGLALKVSLYPKTATSVAGG